MRKIAPIALAIMAFGGISTQGQSSVDLSAGGSLSPSVDLGAVNQAYSPGAGSSGTGASRGRSNTAKAYAPSGSPVSHDMHSGGTYRPKNSSFYGGGTAMASIRSFGGG